MSQVSTPAAAGASLSERVLEDWRARRMPLILSRKQAAAELGLSVPQLERFNAMGTGPRCIQLTKRRVGYPLPALLEWMVSRPTRQVEQAAA